MTRHLQLRELPNGADFQLPDGRTFGRKVYGNDCRVRVTLGSVPVAIKGKTFNVTSQSDWSPFTEVLPMKQDEEVTLDPVTGEII